MLSTWMTMIDCLFYASDSLSWDVSLKCIAKLVVVWLYSWLTQRYIHFFKKNIFNSWLSWQFFFPTIYIIWASAWDFQQCGMCDQQSLRSACAYAQSDQSLCLSLEYPMSVRLLTEHHLRFLSLKGGCTGSSESTLVKMPHCWKSRVTAHLSYRQTSSWSKGGNLSYEFICGLLWYTH